MTHKHGWPTCRPSFVAGWRWSKRPEGVSALEIHDERFLARNVRGPGNDGVQRVLERLSPALFGVAPTTLSMHVDLRASATPTGDRRLALDTGIVRSST